MPPLSFEKRQELVNRINGGQRISGPTGIAAEMGIAVKTIYRLKAKFTQADGSFEVQAAAVAKKQAFTRETLVEISQGSPWSALANPGHHHEPAWWALTTWWDQEQGGALQLNAERP